MRYFHDHDVKDNLKIGVKENLKDKNCVKDYLKDKIDVKDSLKDIKTGVKDNLKDVKNIN